MTAEITEEQLKNLHPFSMWVIDQIEIRDGEPDAVFGDEDIEELASGLELLKGSEELRFAVVSLINLASVLQKSGAPKTAEKIFAVVERPPILDGLRALNAERDRANEDAKASGQKAFEKMAGVEKKPEPAKVGEEPPEDSVRIDGLKFPRRM